MIYSRTFYHVVFSTCRRQRLITSSIEPHVHACLREAFVSQHGVYSCYLNGTEDHVHILVHIDPDLRVAKIVEAAKIAAQEQIAQLSSGFMWQRGCAIFTVSHHDYKGLVQYIRDQKIRHARRQIRDEFEWPEMHRTSR